MDELLHAYVDNMLPPRQRLEVEEYLADHPDMVQRVNDFESQNRGMHRLYDRHLTEPLPESLQTLEYEIVRKLSHRTKSRTAVRVLASALVAVLVAGGGWYAFDRFSTTGVKGNILATFKSGTSSPAARAPAADTANIRQASTTTRRDPASASRSLETFAPDLAKFGLELIRTRLVSDEVKSKTVQLVYESKVGNQVQMYLSPTREKKKQQISLSQEGRISALFWSNGGHSYSLLGEVDRDTILAIGSAVNEQWEAMTGPNMMPSSSATPMEKHSGDGSNINHASKSFIQPVVSPFDRGIKANEQ
ncbi:MAG: hypothetical protein WD407_09480 [Rhodospirillales bacterium]